MPKRLGDDDILLRKRPHKKKKARLDTKNKPSAKKVNAKSKARGSKSKEVQLSDTSWDEEDDLPLTLSPGESALLRGNKTGSKLKIRTQEEINFAYSTCRLCARSRGSHLLIDIFDPSIDLSSLIATLLPISVSRSDRKPLKICQTCAIRLEKFDSFCRSVRRSDAYFNALLGQEKDQVGDVEVTEPKNPSQKVSFKSGVVVPIKLVIRAVTSSQNQINNQTESQANSQTDNQIDCQTDSQADNQIVNQTVKEEWTDKTSLPLGEEENHETPSSDDLPDSVVRASVADPPIKTEPSIEEPPVKPDPSSEVLGDPLKIPSSQTAEKEAVRGRFLQEECDIKEEPQDEIEDRVADDIPGEGDMFETHGDFNIGGGPSGYGTSGDGYMSYGGSSGYSLAGGAGFDTQSSYESNDANYDQGGEYLTEDSKVGILGCGESMQAAHYHLAPRKRGRPKGSKNKNLTPHQSGGRSKVFVNDQYEVNFMHECRECGSQFADILKHSLETHLSVHNTKSQVIYFPCPLCPDKLRTESELGAHVATHADTILAPYECFSCDFSDNDFMAMAKHIVESHCEVTSDNRYECPICEDQETMASSFHELCTHLYESHIPEEKVNLVSCPVCNVRLGNDTAHIRSHLLTHTTRQTFIRPKYYRCPACNAGFKSQINLVKHACPNIVNNRCEECDINFPSKMRHTFHLQHHLEDPMQLKCDICFTDFDDENSLYDHVRFIHVQDNQLKCTICNKENFKNQLSLSIHMRYHENVREYECEICKKKFINKSTLKEHSVSHMSVKPFKCEICGHYLSRASRLRAHLKAHSVVASNNKVFPSNEENLRKHFEKVHFDLEFDEAHFYDVVLKCVYRCEFCDSCFNVPHELNRHRFANHPEPDSPTAFSCMVCGTSIHYTYLCLHKKLKHSNLTYGGESPVCEPCNLTFKNEWQYLVHNRAVHELPPEPNSGAGSVLQNNPYPPLRKNNPYPPLRKAKQHVKSVTCSVCEKAFSSKENCKAHYTRQHGNKEPKEPKSGEGLPALEQLLKMKPYTCEICSKTYTVEGSLLTHYDMHSGEFYQCDVCFKEFRSSVTLRNHTRRHDNFSCDECSVECQDLNALRMHTLREHGYKILACEKCDVKFTHKALLAEHINTKHNTDVTLKCQLCNVAVLIEEVQQHLEEHKVVIIRCETCTRNYESLESLTTHLSFKHSNQFLMKCTNCNVLVPRDEILPHLSIQHCQGTTPSIYECNQCKEKTNDMTTMLNHYSVKHYMDINMSCVPCDVLFHNKATLYKHLYLEHKATSLSIQCNMCSLVLDSKESLVTHISQTHTLMFTCRRCPSTFLNSATLSKHVKMEHNSKSYQCNECPESFERLNKLKRHKFQAHNDSVHQIQCPYCITDFSEDKNLIQHIVSVHLGKEGTAPART
ncbi:hypothetical protein M8J76_000196 [Diaphorina citri]|nr:hypothetical protein M8J76_000196 [Diaphorina citri]